MRDKREFPSIINSLLAIWASGLCALSISSVYASAPIYVVGPDEKTRNLARNGWDSEEGAEPTADPLSAVIVPESCNSGALRKIYTDALQSTFSGETSAGFLFGQNKALKQVVRLDIKGIVNGTLCQSMGRVRGLWELRQLMKRQVVKDGDPTGLSECKSVFDTGLTDGLAMCQDKSCTLQPDYLEKLQGKAGDREGKKSIVGCYVAGYLESGNRCYSSLTSAIATGVEFVSDAVQELAQRCGGDSTFIGRTCGRAAAGLQEFAGVTRSLPEARAREALEKRLDRPAGRTPSSSDSTSGK